MADQWIQCVCQYMQSQSANLINVMNGLGVQNTISDLGGMDQLQALPEQTPLFGAATPMHFFLFLLLAIWSWMQIEHNRNQEPNKPANPNKIEDLDGDNGGAGGGDGGAGGVY